VHDPEKWRPVFGKDHAQTKSYQVLTEVEARRLQPVILKLPSGCC
jgi:hypothetical protein